MGLLFGRPREERTFDLSGSPNFTRPQRLDHPRTRLAPISPPNSLNHPVFSISHLLELSSRIHEHHIRLLSYSRFAFLASFPPTDDIMFELSDDHKRAT
jgi:hypothetical protein